MAEDKGTPADCIRAAIEGKHPNALIRVNAHDTLALCKAVPDEKQTQVTLDLAKGSAGAIGERPQAGPRAKEIEVFQLAGQLRELLEAATGE